MQTEVRVPPHEPEFAPTSAPPRRWPRRVVAIVLILAALVLVTGVVFVANYDPVCGNCGGIGGVHGPGVKDLGYYSSPHGESFNAYGVDLVPGKEFSFWFTLTNPDHVPVTITHIGATPQPYDTYRVTRVQIQDANRANPPLTAFRPFELSGPYKDFMNVLVTMQMRRCMSSGGSTQFGSIPVTFKVMGIPRHTDVYLMSTIRLEGQKGVPCNS